MTWLRTAAWHLAGIGGGDVATVEVDTLAGPHLHPGAFAFHWAGLPSGTDFRTVDDHERRALALCIAVTSGAHATAQTPYHNEPGMNGGPTEIAGYNSAPHPRGTQTPSS
jgi:hypothetical protein